MIDAMKMMLLWLMWTAIIGTPVVILILILQNTVWKWIKAVVSGMFENNPKEMEKLMKVFAVVAFCVITYIVIRYIHIAE